MLCRFLWKYRMILNEENKICILFSRQPSTCFLQTVVYMCTGSIMAESSNHPRANNTQDSSIPENVVSVALSDMCREHATVFTLYCNNCDRFICHDCLVSLHQYHRTSSISDVREKLQTSIVPAIETEVNFILKYIQEYTTTIKTLQSKRDELSPYHDQLEKALKTCLGQMSHLLERGKQSQIEAVQMLETCARSETSLKSTELGHSQGNAPEMFDNNIESHDPNINLVPQRIVPPCLLNVTNGMFNESLENLELLSRFLSKGLQQIHPKVVDHFKSDMFVENIATTSQNEAWISRLGKISLYKANGQKVKSIPTIALDTCYFVLTPEEELIYSNTETHEIRKVSKMGDDLILFSTASFKPHGLCWKNKNAIIVCLQASGYGKLTLFSMDKSKEGHILKDLTCPANGRHTLSKPHKITVNVNDDLLVIDHQYTKVICLHQDGRFRFEYRGQRTFDFEPLGITCDSYANILISDYGSRTIDLLHADGSFITSMNMTELGVSRPMGLTVDSLGNLWIGQGNGKVHVMRYLKVVGHRKSKQDRR